MEADLLHKYFLTESQYGTKFAFYANRFTSNIADNWTKNPKTEQALLAWYDEVLSENWKQPADIKERYAIASILKKRRVVFNIKGNKYRLIVAVAYKIGVVYIKFIGTHKEYDAVDAETVEM